jgi:hypothetical protein
MELDRKEKDKSMLVSHLIPQVFIRTACFILSYIFHFVVISWPYGVRNEVEGCYAYGKEGDCAELVGHGETEQERGKGKGDTRVGSPAKC